MSVLALLYVFHRAILMGILLGVLGALVSVDHQMAHAK